MLATVIVLLVVAAAVAVLLWYFGKNPKEWMSYGITVLVFLLMSCVWALTGVFECNGRECKADNLCISHSKWCNGVSDCPSGEDEAQCCKSLHILKHSLNAYCT